MKTDTVPEIEKALDDLMPRKTDDEAAKSMKGHGPGPDISLKRILVPTDFSDCAKAALDVAVPIARMFGATVFLLHVFPPYYEGELIPGLLLSAEQLLEGLVAESVPVDIFSKMVVRTGPPAEEIVRAASEFNTDLIVISTHGYTGLKHAWFGSTAESVVRYASCPVLTVRAKDHKITEGVSHVR
jgi:nucleotide-binding universal stress UspA family protein